MQIRLISTFGRSLPFARWDGVTLLELLNNQKCAQRLSPESRKGTEAYAESKASHESECSMNHEGSAASLEPEGVVACFERSIDKYISRYTQYLGDGDTKSYLKVVKKDPYNGTSVNNMCIIGHLQKRGARLHKMREDGPFENMM